MPPPTREEIEEARRRLGLRAPAAPPSPVGFAPQPEQAQGFFGGVADVFRGVVPQGVRDVGGGFLQAAGRLAEEADRPLLDRAGIEVGGPIGFVLNELTRPTTLGFALGGVGAATKLASLGRVGRAAGALIAPVGGETFATKLAAETVLSVGGRTAAEAVSTALPETTPAPVRIALSIGAGVLGGGSAVALTRSGVRTAFRRDLLAPPRIRLTPTAVEVGERRGVLLRAKGADQLPTNYDEKAVLGVARDLDRQVSSQSARLIAEARQAIDALGKTFVGDDGNIYLRSITDRAGKAALLQDVLENPTRYRLTVPQLKAIETISIVPQRIAEERVLFNVPVDQADLVVGQNFIPRKAKVDTKGNELVSFRGGGRRLGGGRDHSRTFTDPLDAVGRGVVYEDPLSAIEGYVSTGLKRSSDSHIAELLRPLGQTAADRLSPGLRNAVETVRAKVSGRLQTLRRRKVRATATAAEAGRAERRAESAIGRVERAEARTEGVVRGDLAAARQGVTEIVTEGRTIARAIGENLQRLREAKRTLTAGELKLERQIAVFETRASDIDNIKSDAGFRRAEQRLETAVARLSDRAEKLDTRVSALVERGTLLRDLDAVSRREFVEARRLERATTVQDRQLAVAKRELRVLEAEERRAGRIADVAEERAVGADGRVEASKNDVIRLREELEGITIAWKAAKEQASRVPPGRETVPIGIAPGLVGVDFPTDAARRITNFYGQGTVAPGQTGAILRKVRDINQQIVPMRAIGDASAVLNQLGAIAPTNPVTFFKNFFRALRDAVDLGNYERFLVEQGEDAAAHGIVILGRGGQRTEFEFGSWIERVPVLKQTQRHFQAITTRNRIDIYNSLVDMAERAGRPLDSLAKEEVARSMNRLSGISNSRANDFETLIQFAPNFLRSSIEILNVGLRSGNIEGQLARQYMRNFVLAGQFLVIAGAMGMIPGTEKRDLREVLSPIDTKALARGELRMNGNFATIRAFGQDISVYGRFDSLARLAIVTADASVRAISTQDARELGDAIGYFASTKGSPFVSASTALLMGSTFSGADPASPEGILEQLIPFALSDFMEDMQRGLPPETSIVGGLVSFFGGKANPQTGFEKLDEAARSTLGMSWDQLTGQQKQMLEASLPQLIQRAREDTQRRAKRGDVKSIARLEADDASARRIEREAAIFADLQTDQITLDQFAEALDEAQRDAAIERNQTFRVLGIEFSEPTSGPGRAVAAYYNTFDQAERPSGIIDWDLREALERELFVAIDAGAFGDDPLAARRAVEERKRAVHAPEVAWYFAAKDVVRDSDYYAVRDQAFERFRSRATRVAEQPVESYSRLLALLDGAVRTENRVLERRLSAVKRDVDRVVARERERLVRSDAMLDEALVRIGRRKRPIRRSP